MGEEIELLPCPFDGGKAEFRLTATGCYIFVQCTSCAIEAGEFFIGENEVKGYHVAAKVWNRRVDSRAAVIEDIIQIVAKHIIPGHGVAEPNVKAIITEMIAYKEGVPNG